MKRSWSFSVAALALFAIGACADDESIGPRQRAFERYVSIGTSVSMGYMSDGLIYSGQVSAWPALLARQAFASKFTAPLIQGPGCYSPLIAPLQFGRRLSGAQYPAITAEDQICARYPDITLPTNNVAVDGATTYHALRITPESTVTTPTNIDSDQRKRLYRAVLAPGTSQVTSMMAQNPTLVSVELGANEAFRTVTAGIVIQAARYRQPDGTFTYYPTTLWQPEYDAVIDSVAKTGARGLLVSVPLIPNIVGVYPGDDFFQDRAAFASFGININADCNGNRNSIYAFAKVLVALASPKPHNFVCTDNPAAADFILTQSDTTFVNNLIRQMNSRIQSHATTHSWAYLELNTALASFVGVKAPFSLSRFLNCNRPFGQYISLDGVHPTLDGQQAIANAAADALNATYDLGISRNEQPVLTAAQLCP